VAATPRPTVRNPIGLRDRLDRLRGSPVDLDLSRYDGRLAEVAELETELEGLSLADLKARSGVLREAARSGTPLQGLQTRAVALAREAARRAVGLRPFDVQVVAALALHGGNVVEMQTGEGKTLAAVMPAYLNALGGRGVHVLTFNDYLAERDAEWMGPVYRLLDMTVGWVGAGMAPHERRAAYRADVTYVTAKEAGFDHLRDLLAIEPGQLVHRPFHFALVDEADSILIDEARVPLVIAGSVEGRASSIELATRVVAGLQRGVDYDTDEHGRNVEFKEAGFARLEGELGCGNLHAEENLALLTDLHCALHARALLRRDVDYIVQGGRIGMVDEFTGRVVKDRHWPDGLQAALEVKEGLARKGDGRILGSITLQHFLGLYPELCGMTGTARDAGRELDEFYGLRVVVVPTHRPMIRVDQPDRIFTHREAKEAAVLQEIRRAHATGRPVLVGTLTVEESERLAESARREGLDCEVLNARNDALEARVVAGAGAVGAVTIATNMAGRGTDIRLGGADEEARDVVAGLGGLYVIGTNRHESRRVDLQLRGRAGRQGDPGESRFFVSLDDDLLVRYGLGRLIPGRLSPEKSDEPVENAAIRREVARSQRIIEGQNLEIRRTLWRYSEPIEEQRRDVHERRQALLLGEETPDLWQGDRARYGRLVARLGGEALREAERAVTLFHIDRGWREHLWSVADVREGIHLVRLGGDDPLTRFKVLAGESFRRMREDVERSVREALPEVEEMGATQDLSRLGLKGPASTWTYLINDDPFRELLGSQLTGPGRTTLSIGAAVFATPLLILLGLVDRYLKPRPPRD
jgi:preprotein translocase subunit SecA